MNIHRTLFGLTLLTCLGACTATNEINAVGGDDGMANAASGNEAATAAGGPCPFETRSAQVTVGPSTVPGEGLAVTITIETRPDSEGRQPMLNQRLTPPPEVVLDIDRDPMATPSSDRDWGQSGIGGYPYTPAYTHAVIRCVGTEIARLPIPTP